MFVHNKRLQYTVRVGSTDPGLANLLLEQFGGPQGELAADLRSNIAAEARAKIIYERLINVSDDPGVRDALGFLMTREVSHQKSFEKALYAIAGNFPPGKLAPNPEYADAYFKMSHGAPPERGPWNEGRGLKLVEDPPIPVDGGDGSAAVQLSEKERTTVDEMKRRLKSDRTHDPETGAELGEAEPGTNGLVE